jgi:membrane-associated protease RseP (regulator of RpoE activity)
MGGWFGTVLFVVAILIVVVIHESGHFFFAKAFGIKVEEFFVGFGPRLWSVRRGETEYGIKALPLGGYVRIAGMNPFQETPAADLPRTFGAKPIWQRALVIFAGPVTHFLMAFVFLAVFFAAIGLPTARRPLIEAVDPVLEGQPSPAAQAGLRPGDEVVAVDGLPVQSTDRFVQYTRTRVGQAIELTVRRDDVQTTVTVTPVLSTVAGERVGRIGVRAGPLTAIGRAGLTTGLATRDVIVRLEDVFGPSGLRRFSELLTGEPREATDPTGLVGGARLAAEAAEVGAWDFLFSLLVGFNIFVGIMNLLPLPPLDGGHLAVLAYEKVSRRKPDIRKLVPLTALVAGFLILFVLTVTWLDITNPIPNQFR